MSLIVSGPYRWKLEVLSFLGDIGDRSISGICYSTSLEVRGRENYRKLASQVVSDEAPDWFFHAFKDSLENNVNSCHSVWDEFSFGIYPIEINRGNEWHEQTFEPLNFRGDPDNIFKLIVCINPYGTYSENVPPGGGISLVIPVHRDDLVQFRDDWLDEIRVLIDTWDLDDQRKKEALLRWIPKP